MNSEMPGSGSPEGPPPGGPPPGGPPPGPGMPGPMPGGGVPGPGMPGGGAPMADKASGMAIASLILSIVGLLCGITAIAGIIIGAIELNRIKRGESSPKGKGLAMAGIIIGAIVLGLGIILSLISIATGGFSFEVSS